MERKKFKQIILLEPHKRGHKHSLVTVVFAPMVVVVVHRLPANAMAAGIQVVPLHAGVEDIEYMIKDFVGGYFCLRPTLANRQMRLDVSIKLSAGDLFR